MIYDLNMKLVNIHWIKNIYNARRAAYKTEKNKEKKYHLNAPSIHLRKYAWDNRVYRVLCTHIGTD